MSIPFTPPSYLGKGFNCASCNAYAEQTWYWVGYGASRPSTSVVIDDIRFCKCRHCNAISIWVNQEMILPNEASVPIPNTDLPEAVLVLYLEAKAVLNQSPRSAAALLRLAIELLLKQIGSPGKSINDIISKLVEQGLHPKLQQSLDILRVVGNNAVHAGQIDFNDSSEIANRLFVLINVISDDMISKPKEIEALYNSLPENELKNIAKRDSKIS